MLWVARQPYEERISIKLLPSARFGRQPSALRSGAELNFRIAAKAGVGELIQITWQQ